MLLLRHQAQESQKKYHDSGCRLRTFTKDDPVFVKNFGKTPSLWLTGKISKKTGPLSYRIILDDKRVMRRHVDHIRSRTSTDQPGFDTIVSSSPTPTHVPVSPTLPCIPSAPRRSTRDLHPPNRFSPTWGRKV